MGRLTVLVFAFLLAFGSMAGCGRGFEDHEPPISRDQNYGATNKMAFNSPFKPSISFNPDAMRNDPDAGEEVEEEEE